MSIGVVIWEFVLWIFFFLRIHKVAEHDSVWVGSTLCFGFCIPKWNSFPWQTQQQSKFKVGEERVFYFFKGRVGFAQWPRCVLSELQLSVFKYATWSERGLKRPLWIPWGYFLHSVLAACSSGWIRFIAKALNLHYTWQTYSPAVLVPFHSQSF